VSVYREIIRHSSVYGLGQILSRIASFLLLPLYTSFLTPADYGVLAVLDLTTTVIASLAIGWVEAVVRSHFEPAYRDNPHRLWVSGLVMLAVIAAPLLGFAWVFRGAIAALIFGPTVERGADCLTLALLGLPPRFAFQYALVYARAEKRSTLFLVVTVGGLVLRVALNVYFIAFRGMGVFGFLWSSLLMSILEACVLLGVLFRGRPFRLERSAIKPLWSYGWPLILTGLAGLAMHQVDRYLLRWLLTDLGPVGIYSVVYTIVQAVNQLVLLPFTLIWSTMMFEVDALPERVAVFRRIHRYFVLGIFLALLGVALAATPVMRLMTAAEYSEGAALIPWLALAFFFFSLDAIFRLPAMIHRRTISLAKVSALAALTNVVVNLVLIPKFGIRGAAGTSVLTYAMFAFGGHMIYRRIEDFGFDLRIVGLAAAGGAGLVTLQRALVPPGASLLVWAASAFGFWVLAVAIVLVGPGRELLARWTPVRRRPS
jgi:O-antigen/teichoic acid export membrane protein